MLDWEGESVMTKSKKYNREFQQQTKINPLFAFNHRILMA